MQTRFEGLAEDDQPATLAVGAVPRSGFLAWPIPILLRARTQMPPLPRKLSMTRRAERRCSGPRRAAAHQSSGAWISRRSDTTTLLNSSHTSA
jgi:hypothetical protein